MSNKAPHPRHHYGEGQILSSGTASRTGSKESHRNLRHTLPMAKGTVPMATALSSDNALKIPHQHLATGRKSASPTGSLHHSPALRRGEDANSSLRPENLSKLVAAGCVAATASPSPGGVRKAHPPTARGVAALDRKFMERLQSLAANVADSGTTKNDSQRYDFQWKAVAVCIAVAIAAFAIMAVLLVRWWSFGPQMLQRIPACDTSGCKQVAAEILSRLNHSIHPCDDIQAHVCGPIRWESELVTDTAADMTSLWQKRGAAYLESKRRPQAAFALYEACMSPCEETILELKAFMRERHLRWPEYGSMGKDALYVLLDLLINWGVPFWFEMSLRLLPNETRYSLYINRVNINKWRRQRQVSADQGLLTQYATQFYAIFGASQGARSLIPKLLKWEKEIHAIIDPPENEETHSKGPTILRLPLRVAAAFTPSIPTDKWLLYLNEHLHPYRFEANDSILVDDLSFTAMMSELFQRYSDEDMLYTLGWWFVQQFTVITSLDGGVASYGSVALAQVNRPGDCYALAESRFMQQLFLERARETLGAAGMRQAEEVLEGIRNTTIAMLESLAWMDEKGRKEAAAIVAATRFQAWQSDIADSRTNSWSLLAKKAPGDDYRGLRQTLLAGASNQRGYIEKRTSHGPPLDVKYSNPIGRRGRVSVASEQRGKYGTLNHRVLSTHTTVVQGWIKAAVMYKSRVANWPLDDTFQHRHLSYAQLAHYDYWWNSLFLHMGAFAEPLFFIDSPRSVNYAGLGFMVARHLAKAFDSKRGIWLDLNRKTWGHTWISQESRSFYELKIACVGGSERILNHIIGLEVTHAAAFGTNVGGVTNPETEDLHFSLPGLSNTYSAEMVFFLTYCRATCGSMVGCGDVLRRVDRFGKAFRCHKDSPMTSSPKCSFFRH